MSISQIANARAKRQARALRHAKKAVIAHNLPEVRAFKAVGIQQEKGKVLLQMYGDIENHKLLAVAKLDETGIKDLYANLLSAAGLEKGLIWTP